MSVLCWIWDNRQWLFSGLGVAVVGALIALWRRYRSRRTVVSNVGEQNLAAVVSNVGEQNLAAVVSNVGEQNLAADMRSQGQILVDVTPEYLTSLFKDYTSIQAQKLVEAYIGKWMKVSGRLGDIMPNINNHVQVTFETPSLFHYIIIFMYVHGEEHIGRFSILRRGTYLTVVGQIKEVNRIEVHLDNCKLI